MIFVTVGQELPFDRLIKAVDEWSGKHSRGDVFAQIGQTKRRPINIKWVDFLEPVDYRKRIEEASLIVSHAGVGTITYALKKGKPIIILPRLAELGEHYTSHQKPTAEYFKDKYGIVVVDNKGELINKLDSPDSIKSRKPINFAASEELLKTIKDFINQ